MARLRLLYLTDRLSLAGGADLHLRDVIETMATRHRVTLAFGSRQRGVDPPNGVGAVTVRGLATAVASERGLAALESLLADADVVHLQNVMNPIAIERAVAGGRAAATIQDHRVFCPGRGKWTPASTVCSQPMSAALCLGCFEPSAPGAEAQADCDYARRVIALTAARRHALQGARLIVLSRYMQRELAAVGLPHAEVIPPWVDPGHAPRPGEAFLLAGRLVSHKGPDAGWRAWAQSGCGLPLRVAGSGPLAGALGDAGHARCHRLGWLSRAALRRELWQARALIFPCGWEEPFGIVGLEALAEGTPVVVMGSGGTEDWTATGCVVVPRGDIAAMTTAIAELAADPRRALALGRAGQQALGARFSRVELAPRLERLYARLADRAPSSAGG